MIDEAFTSQWAGAVAQHADLPGLRDACVVTALGPPTGTVTFLFTDIVGSTRMWESERVGMEAALERHDSIVRGAITGHGGHVFATGGDGFAAAFAGATDAIGAARDLQVGISSEAWPVGLELTVRTALHTGEAHERGGDYFGPAVNRTARLMGAAAGGQVLLTQATFDVVADRLEDGWDLAGAGTIQLRDVVGPVTVYRLVTEGMPDVTKPLAGLDGSAGNLPTPVSSLVGRESEIVRLVEAVEEHRLVTLIGVGGIGKTRLALEAVRRSPRAGNAWLVELGPVGELADVASAVASAVGARPSPGVSITESIVDWCAARQPLLVVDNCEHVLAGVAPLVESILAGAPTTTVVATSREPLVIAGEHVFPVASMSASEAAALFVERARSERPGFDETTEQAAVDDICARLDGLPLAIELAAARMRALSAQAISDRLDERFRLLTGGRRTAVERHATLRATVDWSYDLLEASDCEAFDRLSVFAGPFDLQDAVQVCGGDELDVIDSVASLVDQSLLVLESGEPEYRMLETLRAYGRERLDSAALADRARRDHATWFSQKARALYDRSCGPDEVLVGSMLGSQSGDYAAALAWAIDHDELETAVDIACHWMWAGSLNFRWETQWPRHPAETEAPPQTKWFARALLLEATYLLFADGDFNSARSRAQQALELDPEQTLGYVLLAFSELLLGRFDSTEALEWARAAGRHAGRGDPVDRTYGPMAHGQICAQTGRLDEARTLALDWLAFEQDRGFRSGIGMAHHLLGEVEANAGNVDVALQHFQAGLEAALKVSSWVVELNNRRERLPLLIDHDLAAAIPDCQDCLRACRDHFDKGNAVSVFACTVLILGATGDHDSVAQLAPWTGIPVSPGHVERHQTTIQQAKDTLGDRFSKLAAEAADYDFDQITTVAIDALEQASARSLD